MTSTAQQAEYEKPVCRVAYFIELQFAGGTSYICNANMNYTWNSIEWIGLGAIGKISPVEESEAGGSSAMVFSLNAVNASLLALAIGSDSTYRGRPAKMYVCPLNEQFQLIDTPEICWRGNMDTMSVSVEGEEGQLVLKCETSSYSLKRRSTLRINAAQQKQKVPSDTGFDFLNSLMAQPAKWLSVRFQSQ